MGDDSNAPCSYPVPSDAQPEASVGPSAGAAWCEGDLVAFVSGTELPPRCVRCNAPSVKAPLSRTLRWHEPWLYLLILAGVLVYAIAAMVLQKQAVVRYHLCLRHHRRQKFGPLAAFVLALLGAVTLLVGCLEQAEAPIWIGAVWMMGSVVAFAAVGSAPVAARPIAGDIAWVKRVCPQFRAGLPPGPPSWVADRAPVPAVAPVAPRPVGWWTPRNTALVAVGIVTGIVVAIAVILWVDLEREIIFDNSTDEAIHLRIDGVPVAVMPARHSLAVGVASGGHRVDAVTATGAMIAAETLTVPTLGAMEGFRAIYDISGRAQYAIVTVSYCRGGDGCPEPMIAPVAQRFFRLPPLVTGGIDEPFVRDVDGRYGDRQAITHLCHVLPDDSVGCPGP